MVKSIFVVDYTSQQKVLGELLKESSSRSNFYFLLGCAALIATIGLLIDNAVFILGGMLVAPLLFPVLSLAMALITSSRLALGRALSTTGRAIALIVVVAFLATWLIGWETVDLTGEILFRIEPNLLFFVVAFTAGLAVAYSWIKRDISATLPGIAVSVSLVPPLAATGIGLAMWNWQIIAGGLSVFLLDLLGIVMASMLIFALFGFAGLQEEEEERIVEEKLEEKVQKQAVSEAAADNQNNQGS